MSTKSVATEPLFDPKRLKALARENRQRYAENQPFPHIVIDNFLPESVTERILAIFPSPEAERWESTIRSTSKTSDQRRYPYGCVLARRAVSV